MSIVKGQALKFYKEIKVAVDKECSRISCVDFSIDGIGDIWESCKECEGTGRYLNVLDYPERIDECIYCDGTGNHRFGDGWFIHEDSYSWE